MHWLNFKKTILIALIGMLLSPGLIFAVTTDEQLGSKLPTNTGAGFNRFFDAAASGAAANALFGPAGGPLVAGATKGLVDLIKNPSDATSIIGGGILAVLGKIISVNALIVNYVIGFIGGALFAFGGVLLQIGLELNARLILSPIVRTGWVIARDFANLGFVIAIIIMAFATMLRLETFGMKKILVNLIIAALLVNFSLSIAGVFIDATGVISNFFIQQVAPGDLNGIHNFATNLASVFQLQKLNKVADLTELPDFSGLGEFTSTTLGLIASIFFVALFTVIGAAVMLMIAGLIVIRYIALSLLLILMPLAIVAFVFPNLQENWKKWQKNFTNWLVFMPVTLFFLYLTIVITNNFKTDPNSFSLISQSADPANAGLARSFFLPFADAFQIMSQMTVILGLLIGGLVVARSFSLQFSDSIINTAEGIKNWAIGKAKETAYSPAQWTGRKILSSKAAQGIARGLVRTPVFKGAGSALANTIAASQTAQQKDVNDFRDKYLKNLPNASDVHSAARTFGIPRALTPIAQAAELAELADRNKIDDVLDKMGVDEKEKTINNWLKAAQKTGIIDDILTVKPEWAPRVGLDVSKFANKGDVLKISKGALANADVLAVLSENKIKDLIGGANKEIREIVKKTIRDEINKIKTAHGLSDDELQKFINLTEKQLDKLAAKQNITEEQLLTLRDSEIKELKSAKNLTDRDIDRIKNIITAHSKIITNPTWQT